MGGTNLRPGGDDPFSSSPNFSETNSQNVREAHVAALRENARLVRAKLSNEEQIRFELNQPASITAVEELLWNFVRTLSDAHDIPILVDGKALEEIGLNSDTPISVSLKDVSLRSLLRLSLKELGLTYCISNEVLLITSVEAAEQMPTLKTYTLPVALIDKGDKILAALKTNVNPHTWDLNKGPSTATMVDNVLVVSGTETVHEQVQDFIQKVTKAFERTQAAR